MKKLKKVDLILARILGFVYILGLFILNKILQILMKNGIFSHIVKLFHYNSGLRIIQSCLS